MARWFYAREIVEEESVAARADELTKSFPRFDDAYEALKWLLARRCDKLPAMTRTVRGERYHLYRQAGNDRNDIPDIIVLFTYDENRVNVCGMEAEKNQEN